MDQEEARKTFRKKYPTTWKVVRDLMKCKSNKYIMDKHFITIKTLATIKSNLNREGRYSSLAQMCNF